MKTRVRRPDRRGLTSIAVLVLLFVIGLISINLVKLGFTYRERARARERAIQSELLADAGLGRAFARLGADPAYQGERWEVPAASLGLAPAEEPAAIVEIRVEAAPAGGRSIHVQADYPPDPPRRARSSREAVFPAKP